MSMLIFYSFFSLTESLEEKTPRSYNLE